jgi:hypothetical protein
MKIFKPTHALMAAFTGLAMVSYINIAHADVKDYEFQLVEAAVSVGPQTLITVRLVNKTTGKPVPDAVIFATRLDMAPDGMAGMQTKIAPISSTEPGAYKFKANVSVAGRWRLSLGAKVQGEAGTVESKLVVKAQ